MIYLFFHRKMNVNIQIYCNENKKKSKKKIIGISSHPMGMKYT